MFGKKTIALVLGLGIFSIFAFSKRTSKSASEAVQDENEALKDKKADDFKKEIMRELGKKGGKKSGQSRRKKKTETVEVIENGVS